MNLNDWKQSGKYFDFEGHEIFYHLSKPSDEIVLCLHGFPSASFDYHKIWDGLTDRFAVLAFDLIGYGFSAKPANFDYTTFRQVDILQSLVESLEIKKVYILAHDYGNTITQELLARAEENSLNFEIKSICFLNGALFPETHRPILAQKILISPIGFLFGKLISDSIFKKNLATIFGKDTQPTKEELDDFVTLFKHNGGKKIAHKLIRYMSERAEYLERWVGALERIKVPFRFINGSADKVSGKHLVARFREVLPHQTDIIEYENIGHFPHFEIPDEILKKYFEFRNKF